MASNFSSILAYLGIYVLCKITFVSLHPNGGELNLAVGHPKNKKDIHRDILISSYNPVSMLSTCGISPMRAQNKFSAETGFPAHSDSLGHQS